MNNAFEAINLEELSKGRQNVDELEKIALEEVEAQLAELTEKSRTNVIQSSTDSVEGDPDSPKVTQSQTAVFKGVSIGPKISSPASPSGKRLIKKSSGSSNPKSPARPTSTFGQKRTTPTKLGKAAAEPEESKQVVFKFEKPPNKLERPPNNSVWILYCNLKSRDPESLMIEIKAKMSVKVKTSKSFEVKMEKVMTEEEANSEILNSGSVGIKIDLNTNAPPEIWKKGGAGSAVKIQRVFVDYKKKWYKVLVEDAQTIVSNLAVVK
eukprot:Platyproteum_vivax@DN7055_c0_g1_i2.p2